MRGVFPRRSKLVELKKTSSRNLRGFYAYTFDDKSMAAQQRGQDKTGSYKIKLSPDPTSVDKLDEMRDGYIPEIIRLNAEYERLVNEFSTRKGKEEEVDFGEVPFQVN